jgi:glycosyltransferase involved in cell wall biosynthesis
MFFKTWFILLKERPKSIFVANTPVFAPLSVYFYCAITGATFFMDIHGLSFIGWKWAWSASLQKFLAKKALVSLVDHNHHRDIYLEWGGKILMLERPPITAPQSLSKDETSDAPLVTFVGNFMGDEPVDLLLDVAKKLPTIKFCILGDTARAKSGLVEQAPVNVFFPGYLQRKQYWQQLYDSNTVMVLTKTPYSLVSGGIEAMSIGKPLILSRKPALLDYFTKGTIFVDHTLENLSEGIETALDQENKLTTEMEELATNQISRWESEFKKLEDMIRN